MSNTKRTFQVFQSGYVGGVDIQEKLLPYGVEEDSSNSVQTNQNESEEKLLPTGFKEQE